MVEPTDGTLFRAEYEREMEAWLRRRFGWLLGATVGIGTLAVIFLLGPVVDLTARLMRVDLSPRQAGSSAP